MTGIGVSLDYWPVTKLVKVRLKCRREDIGLAMNPGCLWFLSAGVLKWCHSPPFLSWYLIECRPYSRHPRSPIDEGPTCGMETIPELRPIVEDGKPMFSGGANDFVQQVEQVRLRRCKLLKKPKLRFQ